MVLLVFTVPMAAFTSLGTTSTKRMVLLVFTVPMAAFTSLGTTSPRYIMQHAMYFPWRGSHFTIWFSGSNTEFVISATDNCSWYATSAEITGANAQSGKWILGYGTKLVWNSVRSTFSAPSNRNEAVTEEMH